jgi:outer membrane protein
MPRSKRSASRLGPAALAATAVMLASSAAHAEEPASVRALTLADAVALAKERAPMVHAAFARIATAEATLDRARAPHLPTVAVQGSGTAFASNGVIVANGVQSLDTSQTYLMGQGAVNLQWMLYDFGRTSNAIDAAEAGVSSADHSARVAEQQAMSEAAVAYFTLLADDAFVQSQEEVRADRERVVTVTHRLVEGGYRTSVDEMRAQVELERAKLDLQMAEATRDRDAVVLASALMLDPLTTFRLTKPAPIDVDVRSHPEGAASLRSHREIAAARRRLEQTRFDLTAAQRGHLPVLAMQGQGAVAYSRMLSPTPANNPTELVTGSLTLTIPIFDPMVNANVKIAEAAVGEAQAALEQAMVRVRSEASRVATDVRHARAVLEQSQRFAAAAAASLAAMEDRYAKGMEGPLPLADAAREDALARVAIVRNQLNLDVTQVRLLAGLSRADELLRAR